MRALLLALSGLLLLTSTASAAGPVVGQGCVANWTAMTTNQGGTPVVSPIVYRVYVYTTTPPTPGTTAPTLETQATSNVKICTGLPPGVQHNYQVSAVETFAAGDVTEGPLSDPVPFVPDAPAKVGGAGIR